MSKLLTNQPEGIVYVDFFVVFLPNFFTIFVSPNKEIYVAALMVPQRQYRETRLVKTGHISRQVAGLETQIMALMGPGMMFIYQAGLIFCFVSLWMLVGSRLNRILLHLQSAMSYPGMPVNC
jgi:hypothetical protein